MISDTLLEAVAEIRGYLSDMPSVYISRRAWIDRVIREMEMLRIELDSSSGGLPEPAAERSKMLREMDALLLEPEISAAARVLIIGAIQFTEEKERRS